MASFKNKTVLITGAASGIGYLMGLKALERGAKHLVMWDIDGNSLKTKSELLINKGFSVSTYIVDVSSVNAIQQAAKIVMEKHNHVDFIFNNAGIIVGKTFVEHSSKNIEQTMAINATGVMHVTRAFLPSMIANKEGYVINISSAASLTPNPGMSVYAASKWAITGWSESLRLELAQVSKNLRVLTVMPSYIETGMFAGVTAPRLVPLLQPDFITNKILDAVEKNKYILREPFMVKLTPFLRGVLPSSLYDFVAGKLFRVYASMSTFKGRVKNE